MKSTLTEVQSIYCTADAQTSIQLAVPPVSSPVSIYILKDVGIVTFVVGPTNAKCLNELLLLDILTADSVMFPTVLIVPPALLVVPARIEQTYEICPCVILFPSASFLNVIH